MDLTSITDFLFSLQKLTISMVRDCNTQEPLLFSPTQSYASLLISDTWLESNKIWKIAAPSIFNRLSMFSLTVITQSFAGHLGDLQLSAISIATTVIIAISFGFLLGMASALETLCGQAYGAKQYHMMGIYMQRSWIVLFLTSILLLPLFIFATPILKLTGQSPKVAELSGEVAMWLIPMHLSFAFQFTLMRFLQCQLKTAVIAWVSGGTLVIHVLISWFFVYYLEVGLVATAITLDFSWWISVFGLCFYSFCGCCRNSWTGFSMEAFFGLWDFFKLSFASGIMLSLLIIIAGNMKNTDVAVNALSICIAIYAWESMIPLGFFAAIGVRVANEIGARNAKGAKFATIVSVLTSLITGLVFWLTIMAFPNLLVSIFTVSTPVIAMVKHLSFLLALTVLLNSIQPVLSGVAVGLGWQGIVAFVNIGSYYVIGIPLGIIFGVLFQFGIEGIWAGMISGTVVQTIILAFMTVRCGWNQR